MRLTVILSLIFFSYSVLIQTKNTTTTYANYNVVPLVQKVTYLSDQSNFILNKKTKISYVDDDLLHLADFLSDYIYENIGLKLDIEQGQSEKNQIVLKTGLESENPEAYQIDIQPNLIVVNGTSPAAIFRALQTLRKSIPAKRTDRIVFPIAQIDDFPKFKHRGALLDVSRHFYSFDFIKKFIDVLALYNMNVFHWHLTDDQGWRVEIKKYPKLTQVGSQRKETAIDRHSEEYDGKLYGGYYTQEQIKELVDYARQRHITVIPEIDIPGHTLAALASYPELGCTGGPYDVGRGWGIYEDVLCVGNDSVFTFLDDVFSEIAALFPAEYIHIGGDECLKNRWMSCPKCKKRIDDLRLADTREHLVGEQLQSYFIRRVEKIINNKGKKIIGWDEIQEGGIAPNATIMSWRGVEGGIYAANEGHDVIMTPEAYVYLDYYQSTQSAEPYTFGWLTDLKKVYSFDPIPVGLSQDKYNYILGGQVNVWTEYIPDEKSVEYMLLPRMAALAETLWSYPDKKDYNDFVSRMYKQSLFLDKLAYRNCKIAYAVQAEYKYDTINHEIKAVLSTFDNTPIYYTLDGREPNKRSQIYKEPVKINSSATLRAVVFRNNKREQEYTQEFKFNKATLRPIKLVSKPDKKYPFGGQTTLVDGQSGSKESYRTGTWIGFMGQELNATIHLDPKTIVSSVSVNCFINTRGGLFPPGYMIVQLSDDGKDFSTVYSQDFSIPDAHQKPYIGDYKANFDQRRANYIRVILKPIKSFLSNWSEKMLSSTYLMVDEIVVE